MISAPFHILLVYVIYFSEGAARVFPAVKRNPESPEAASTMFDNEASADTQEIIDEDELSRVSSKSASW